MHTQKEKKINYKKYKSTGTAEKRDPTQMLLMPITNHVSEL